MAKTVKPGMPNTTSAKFVAVKKAPAVSGRTPLTKGNDDLGAVKTAATRVGTK